MLHNAWNVPFWLGVRKKIGHPGYFYLKCSTIHNTFQKECPFLAMSFVCILLILVTY